MRIGLPAGYPVVNHAVTVPAERCHEPKVIRSTIAEPPKMVRFQGGSELRRQKRCCTTTPLASAIRPKQDIGSDGVTALVI